MIKYNIIIDPKAAKQIKDIFDYAFVQFLNEEVAYSILKSIEKGIRELEYFPESHTLVDNEPWRTIGIRKKIIKTYLIYYYVNKDAKLVYILMIAHSKMDQKRQLEGI